MGHDHMDFGIAVYAGSFDPPTLGHAWMIERGARLFEQLIVAIGVNPDKKSLFSLTEREEMLLALTSGCLNVRIASFENELLVRFARRHGAYHILRGIRSSADYEYERGMRHINADQECDIETVFFMPPRSIAEVSSSLIKGLVGLEGWEAMVAPYVPRIVLEKLKEKNDATRR